MCRVRCLNLQLETSHSLEVGAKSLSLNQGDLPPIFYKDSAGELSAHSLIQILLVMHLINQQAQGPVVVHDGALC